MEAGCYFLRRKDSECVELSEAKWIDASLSQPEQDVEVLVLLKTVAEGCYKIAFGHIVDKSKYVDYNGWNIEGVKYWIPLPKIPSL